MRKLKPVTANPLSYLALVTIMHVLGKLSETKQNQDITFWLSYPPGLRAFSSRLPSPLDEPSVLQEFSSIHIFLLEFAEELAAWSARGSRIWSRTFCRWRGGPVDLSFLILDYLCKLFWASLTDSKTSTLMQLYFGLGLRSIYDLHSASFFLHHHCTMSNNRRRPAIITPVFHFLNTVASWV